MRSGSAFWPPVVVVADEGGADLGRVFLDLERPGAVEALLVVALVARRDDDGVVVVGRQHVGEVAVRRVEVEFDRVVVDLLAWRPSTGCR